MKKSKIGSFNVIDNFDNILTCWGNSEEKKEDELYDKITKSCTIKDEIFINNKLSGGDIVVNYSYYKGEEINLLSLRRQLFAELNKELQMYDYILCEKR